MRSFSRPLLLLCLPAAMIAALSVPAGASAKTAARLSVRGTEGYRLTVFETGLDTELQATRDKVHAFNHGTSTEYIARAKPGAGRVDADFGELGQIAMRFRPGGLTTYSKPRRGCRGPDRYTYRHGVFIGSFVFRGEGGFTSVRAHRAKGTIATPSGPLHCGGSGQEPPTDLGRTKGQKRTSLEAGWHSGLTARFFSATTHGHDPARFSATSYETRGALAIFRGAFANASPQRFAFDPSLSFASVSPPLPFTGTGTIERTPSGVKTWTGTLAVSFPGAPDVPLTGLPFKTFLSRGF
jgi:hypothetical protein